MTINRRKFLQNAAFLSATLFLFSGNVFAANTELIENIKAVCLAPSQQGKYWNVTVKGDIKVDGSVKLIAAGVKGEANFSKGEWAGVQQVLKERQPDDNDSFRKCSMTLTPLFLEKFNASSSINPINSNKTKSAKSKSPSTKPEPAKATNIHQEAEGSKNANVNKTGDGDVNITIQ
jgi:hypothetical protein